MLEVVYLGRSAGAALGGKAAALDALVREGHPVPPGFVIPSNFAMEGCGSSEWEEAVAAIGGFPVAVRSSAGAEDLAEASFAGQYESFLGVESVGELLRRVEDCRRSGESARAQVYAREKGIELGGMNVLVQRMVPARVAGVCFTLHPMTGREDHALVEYCDGLGDALVSGRVEPARAVLALRDGALVAEERPEGMGQRLADPERRELAALALRVQAKFGRPQDIEWAIDGEGKLWVLQSRAITAIRWRSDIEEYTNADFKDGGVSARVCSALMATLYRDAMQESMPRYLRAIRLISRRSRETYIDCFYGRPYWNASAIKRALAKVPGFDEREFDSDLGIQKDYGERGPIRVPTSLRTVLPALPVAIALERGYSSQLRLARGYGKRFLPREAGWLADTQVFGGWPDFRFFGRFLAVLDFHQVTETDYFQTIYNNSNAQSDFKKTLEKVSKRIGRKVPLVRLMSGLTEVSHLRIQAGLLKLGEVSRSSGFETPEWRGSFGEFLAANYFHGDSELDLTTPRWGEKPERVEEMVREEMASGRVALDPSETSRKQRAAFEAERDEILRELGPSFLRASFASQLKRSREFLRLREEMREYSTRSYHLVRLHALEAGRRWARDGLLGEATDVFHLPVERIREWIAGKGPDLRAESEFRGLMYQGYRDLVPPDELGGSVRQRAAERYCEGAQVLRGTGCSPGVVEALVRVVPDLAGCGALQKGEILVTRFTDPGWTAVLGSAAGVVTEVGGLLSHAAVIGREFGIPAVLNIRGATQALRTGQRVRIDGTEGTVAILESGL